MPGSFLDRLRLHLNNPANDPNLREIERYASRILGPFQTWSTTTPNAGRPAPTALQWTGSTTNPTLGNGDLQGSYREFGDLIFINITLLCGSTTTLGNGNWGFTLPYPPLAAGRQIMAAGITSGTLARCVTATAIIRPPGITSIVVAGGNLTHATGFANGDRLTIQGFYIPA